MGAIVAGILFSVIDGERGRFEYGTPCASWAKAHWTRTARGRPAVHTARATIDPPKPRDGSADEAGVRSRSSGLTERPRDNTPTRCGPGPTFWQRIVSRWFD